VGYGRESIANAVRDQLVKLNFFAGAAGTVPAALFAQKLVSKMPGMSRVYYSNSGSEANEKAYKMVRQIAHRRHGGKKWKILYRERDYHGTTIAALASGGQPERAAQYGPFPDGFVPVPHCLEYRAQWDVADYGRRAADAIEEVILREGPDTVGAIVLEPITAGGGVIVPPEGYWPRVQEICRKYDILLHHRRGGLRARAHGHLVRLPAFRGGARHRDHGQGRGLGLRGHLLHGHDRAVFDMFKDDAGDPLGYFRDISTFGGCTGGPAAALENMRIIEDEGLIENTIAMGARLEANLLALKERHAMVGDVRGKGLFWGVELVQDRASRDPVPEAVARAVVAATLERGVMIGVTNRSLPGFNNTLCLSPALIATAADIDEITDAIDGALAQVAA
jgi:taurine-pyruvate aminotransferase